MKSIKYSIIGVTFILMIWWLITFFEFVNPLFIPKITDTLKALINLLSQRITLESIFSTLYRSMAGMALSMLVGIPLGILLARHKILYGIFKFPIEFFRAIPSSALFPLFILIFGIGDLSKIGVVFYACTLILIINAFYGALPSQEKTDRINMLKSFGANQPQLFRYTIFQDALSNISAGVRVCLSYSFALVVVTEMFLGAEKGIGKLIYDFYLQYRIPEMYAVIIILGFIGFILNQAYLKLESKYFHWINN
jgi:NitT/TauT family transport system permease protein